MTEFWTNYGALVIARAGQQAAAMTWVPSFPRAGWLGARIVRAWRRRRDLQRRGGE
jgi:hypothetical protein